MKHGTGTRGVRRADDADGISLFPFLAVLICAAGLLIVLLVVMGRHARAQGTRMAELKRVEAQKDLKRQREDVRWRIEQLQKSLAATRQQLVDSQLALGHLEDHSRGLRQQLASLERDWNQLQQPATSQQQAAVETQLRELSARIDLMKSRLDEARRGALARQRTYAVVPYEGPYGTRRRPIYLECRGDALLLQPEGIVFKASDFEMPLGPDNPLAAALRAAREYLLSSGQVDPAKSGEPYPLLLVRPLGIHAYYAAREAMTSWESNFGYEMVDADWNLEFGEADPRLAEVVRQAVEAARARQARLAAAAPRYYRQVREAAGGASPRYTVSGSGVVVPYGETGDADSWPTPRQRGAVAGGPRSAQSGGDGSGNEPGDGGVQPSGSPLGSGQLSGDAGGTAPGGATLPGANGAGGTSVLANGQTTTAGSASPSLGGGSPGGLFGGSSGGSLGGSPGGAAGGNSAGSLQGSSGDPNPLRAEAAASTGADKNTGLSPMMAARDGNATAAAPGAGGSPRRLGEWYPGMHEADPSSTGEPPPPGMPPHKPPKRKQKSMAEKRGRDWAVPDARPEATPLTQPIHVECHADRFVLVAQRGLAGGRTIAMGPQTRDSVDELVSAVWKYTEGWGMAGNGMYWRPVLHVYVCPGAEDRYDDLVDLLQDSGLLIERKN